MASQPDGTPAALRSRLISLSRAGYKSLEKNRLQEASTYFEQILALDPRNSYALVGRAELARKKKDWRGARGFFRECLRHEPRNLFALKGEAECAWELHDFPAAVEAWQACLDETGDDATLLTHLADGWRRLGKTEDSRAAYEKALALQPDNRYALNGLANLLYDAGDYQAAVTL